MHPGVVAETVAGIEAVGGHVVVDERTDLLIVNHAVTVALVIARCRTTATGSLRWKVRLDTGLRPDLTVVVRLESDDRTVRDYYLLPWMDVGGRAHVGMQEDNAFDLDAYRTRNLAPLYHLLRRHELEHAL
jgi:hypothetical protein